MILNENIDLRDVPINNCKKDLLKLDEYAKALVDFIFKSETPITISLQGEWGSGKTSLMNLMEMKLSVDHNEEGYESVWINTWEFFINDDSEAMKKIILSIINDITKIGRQKTDGYKNELIQLFDIVKNISKKTVDALLSTVGVDSDSRKSVFELLDSNQITLIKSLRNSVEKWVKKLVESDNNVSNKGFIFFVDDLDRIEPENAVQILEIFKNIFDIKYCVFILAIDYEVIVKGLKRKYGEYKESDENDFKAYFDKLVQLPFVMPVANYDIKKLLINSLLKIKYITSKEEFSYLYYSYILKAITYTIGNNPRRIKRMINALNLSYIYDLSNSNILHDSESKLLNILLICLQQGFQQVYNLLSYNPDFKSWKESEFSFFISKETREDNSSFNEDICQEWEITLYKICMSKPSLKEKATNIMYLFSIFDKLIVEKTITVNDIKRVQKISSLTNFSYQGEHTLVFDGRNYDKSSQTQYAQSQNLIDETIIIENSLVLDIGCGNGKSTISLFNKNKNKDFKIEAFDLSETQIDMAIENRNSNGIGKEQIFFYVMDAFELSEVEKYDLIFSNATLHWITEGKEMYKKIYMALKKNGRIAIHQGGKDSYKGLHNAVKEAIKNLEYEKYFSDWEFPIFYPSGDEIEQILNEVGFGNINIIDSITDGSEYKDLVDNFSNASMLPYLSRLPKNKKAALKKEYFRVCKQSKIDLYTHRLYIFAEKVI